jgi:hypothetical protein
VGRSEAPPMATRACITSAAGTSRATRARFATACDLFVSRYATWKLARGCCYFRGEQNAAFHAVCCVWDGGRCIRRATHTALSGSLRRAPGYASFATGLPRSTALSGRLQLAVVFSWFSDCWSPITEFLARQANAAAEFARSSRGGGGGGGGGGQGGGAAGRGGVFAFCVVLRRRARNLVALVSGVWPTARQLDPELVTFVSGRRAAQATRRPGMF